MEFYWELSIRDGSKVEVPPAAAPVVKRRWEAGLPINLRTRSIPSHQIVDFQQTGRRFTTQPLLEEVAQAFKEPIQDEEGTILTRWVKKVVTQDRWNRYYSANPAYRHLKDESGMAVIAFRLPAHLIDINKTPYCDDDEIKSLDKYIKS